MPVTSLIIVRFQSAKSSRKLLISSIWWLFRWPMLFPVVSTGRNDIVPMCYSSHLTEMGMTMSFPPVETTENDGEWQGMIPFDRGHQGAFQHFSNVGITWFPCGNHIVSTWTSHGFHMDTMWFLCGHNMVSTWTPCAIQVDTTCFPCGYHVISMWTLSSFQVDTSWLPHGHHVLFRWTPHGFNMATMWFPCEHYIFKCGHHMLWNVDITWFPHGHHMVSTSTPHGFHMDTICFSGIHMDTSTKTALHEANWLSCCSFVWLVFQYRKALQFL